jgi:hypothetical protein
MQQSKAYVIKSQARHLKATIAARKAEYALYRYGDHETVHTRKEYHGAAQRGRKS